MAIAKSLNFLHGLVYYYYDIITKVATLIRPLKIITNNHSID